MVRKSDQGRIDYPVGTIGKIQSPAGNRSRSGFAACGFADREVTSRVREAATRLSSSKSSGISGTLFQLLRCWQTPDTYRTSYWSGYRQWDIAMQLTAELYQQIVKALRSDKRTIQDRRRYPRVGLRARINIIPLDSRRKPMEAQCVWVRDVSAGGFGRVVGQKL